MDYSSSDVEFLGAYRDRSNQLIVGMKFDAQAQERSLCGSFDLDDYPVLLDVWVVIRPDGTVSLLGSRMFPVGAADLDQDGESEWLFKLSTGHGDGYRLFYDGLVRKVDALWPPY